MEVARRPGLVVRRHPLHRRDLQEHRQATFAKGASLPDPAGLFNVSLEGGTRHAIDLRQGDELDEAAFKALVRAAVKRSQGGGR
jgi:hypothetical protein